MLELVSLTPTESKRRLRNYSLGMKQRLGIAHALLGDPSVLILDEPANGLDPAGIRWMRGLLKGYADRGGTVLLSSHLLNEVELIADEMILIGHGRIVAQGNKKSLLAGAAGAVSTLVTSLDNEGLATALKAKGIVVASAGDGLRVEAEPVEVGRVAARARHRAHRPPHRRGRARGPVPRAHLRHPARAPRGRAVRMTTLTTETLGHSMDISGTKPLPFSRLVRVELRKTWDTRAGLWLLISMGILTALVMVIQLAVVVVQDLSVGYADFMTSHQLLDLDPAAGPRHPAADQ